MLLKNMMLIFCQSGNVSKCMNGNNFGSYTSSNYVGREVQGCHYGGTDSSGFHVIVGGGDTPPTSDDYDMADTSILGTTKLRSLKQGATFSLLNSAFITTQWRNDSSAPIIVKEVGLAYKINNNAYDKSVNVLVSRKVLNNPVTIQPGETYTFAYNIKV